MFSSALSGGNGWRCPTCQSSNNPGVLRCTACGRQAPDNTRGGSTPPPPNFTGGGGGMSGSRSGTPQNHVNNYNNNSNAVGGGRSVSLGQLMGNNTASPPPPPPPPAALVTSSRNQQFGQSNNLSNGRNQPQPQQQQQQQNPRTAGVGGDFLTNLQDGERTPPPSSLALSPFPNNVHGNNNAGTGSRNSSFATPLLSAQNNHGGTQNPIQSASNQQQQQRATTIQQQPQPQQQQNQQQQATPISNLMNPMSIASPTPGPRTPIPYSNTNNNNNNINPLHTDPSLNVHSSAPTPSGVLPESLTIGGAEMADEHRAHNPQYSARRSPSTKTSFERSAAEMEARGAGFNHPMQKQEYEMEIAFLRNAMSESKKYGLEIENTVEYLTDLLRRKSLECESLRTLATENYEPVRHAIQEQYKSQKKVEKNAQNELKYFQGRIETLYGERTTLLVENNRLKEKIAELERNLVVAQTKQSRPDDNSFFNKVLYDNADKPPYQEFKIHVSNAQVPLMSVLTKIPPLRAKDLQKMRALELAKIMLDPDIAARLYKFGFFNYLHHLFTILLTEQNVSPETFAQDISVAYKRYLEYAKEPPETASAMKNKHFLDKLTKLYQAFMPEQKPELEALLTLHKHNEADLWASVIQNMAEVFEEREKAAKALAAQAFASANRLAGGGGGGGGSGGSGAVELTPEQLEAAAALIPNDNLNFLDADDEDTASPKYSRNAFGSERGKKAGDYNYDWAQDKTENKNDDEANDEDELNNTRNSYGSIARTKSGFDEDDDHDPYFDPENKENSASPSRGNNNNNSRLGSSRGSALRDSSSLGVRRQASPASPITQETLDFHTRIVLMCAKYNPKKLQSKELSVTMEKYPPEVLLAAFVEKYGAEPTGAERKRLLEQIAS